MFLLFDSMVQHGLLWEIFVIITPIVRNLQDGIISKEKNLVFHIVFLLTVIVEQLQCHMKLLILLIEYKFYNKMLSINYLSQFFACLFSSIFRQFSILTPIDAFGRMPSQGDMSSTTNFRSITIGSLFSKIFKLKIDDEISVFHTFFKVTSCNLVFKKVSIKTKA